MLDIHIITLFPEMFDSFIRSPFILRARDANAVSVHLHNLRDYTHDRHKTVDDVPFGGGPGMVLLPRPLFEAVESITAEAPADRIVLMTPQGELLTQQKVASLARESRIVLICGRYEGVDERVREHLVTDELSVGDYVLAGGELPAMVLVEAVVRLLPGAVGCADSVFDESHSFAMLEYPQYTRPSDFRGWRVPKVLISGDHERIRRWRARKSLERTLLRRPDLVEKWDREAVRAEVLKRLSEALGEE